MLVCFSFSNLRTIMINKYFQSSDSIWPRWASLRRRASLCLFLSSGARSSKQVIACSTKGNHKVKGTPEPLKK